ncbi:MSCRAMM family protein [Agromyces italicus]|uniref:MSCRAMM family protein n=1 Tax=Agromyces italicus TaxID=279572 RepID=UPI0003B4354C|nr:carboxypeptidase regulatory-like domain-containing protein [Agromyces italicus]
MIRGTHSFAIVALAALTALVVASPASAATTASWAAWTPLTGTSGAFTSAVTLAGQPALTADITSNSRSGQVGVISGASNWLAEGTAVGAKYGSSSGQQYLNLRPKADNAASPSTTSYSFATPTPPSGWTFVLGDIDADQVRIHAIGADGVALTSAELGFRGGFNYCAPGIVGKPVCTGDASDVPSWDATTLTLTGNAAAADTSGSAAWFEPSAPISSLSFVFTRRAGFPVYQTWFASLARDITGTVTDVADGPLDGVEVTLVDRNGDVVANTTTADGGRYSFPGFIATDGYTVEITSPSGKIATEANRKPADLADADAVVDFSVRDIVPVAVSGRVTDDAGDPVPGVDVTIDGRTTTTDSNGEYRFDTVPAGTHTATITTPDGYTLTTSPPPFTVPENSETPITGIDFVVDALPSLSGTVTAAGVGVAGVTVTAAGPDGTVSAVTNAAGDYTFPTLPPGVYEITMTTPDGYLVVGTPTRTETVAGADLENVDFELARTGAIEGVVSDTDGAPIGGVVVTVEGPDGPVELPTGGAGEYSLGDLPPGTYTVTIEVPQGYTASGEVTRTVTITAAGEVFTEQDFVLAPVVAPTPSPSPTPTPSPSPSPGDGGSTPSGALPATGVSAAAPAIAGVLALGVGLGAVAFARGGRRRTR